MATKPVAKPSLTLSKHQCRATSIGFANNQLYEAGDEFEHVVDSSLEPAAWFEVLDDGVPVKERTNLNAAKVAGEDVKPRTQGFAAGSGVI